MRDTILAFQVHKVAVAWVTVAELLIPIDREKLALDHDARTQLRFHGNQTRLGLLR